MVLHLRLAPSLFVRHQALRRNIMLARTALIALCASVSVAGVAAQQTTPTPTPQRTTPTPTATPQRTTPTPTSTPQRTSPGTSTQPFVVSGCVSALPGAAAGG